MPPIRVPTKQPDGQSTTVDVQPSDPPWTSARDLIRAALASWPKQDRGELGAADEDETTWALLGWERRTAKEKQEDEDEPRHWNGSSASLSAVSSCSPGAELLNTTFDRPASSRRSAPRAAAV